MTDAPLVLTMGDPAGVGPELAVAAWRHLKSRRDGPCFVWVGDPSLISQAVPVCDVCPSGDASSIFSEALPVVPVRCLAAVHPGRPNPANAPAIIESIRQAVDMAKNGVAAAVVTNPIAKHVLARHGFPYPGHTEFLAGLCGVSGQEIMMLVSPRLRVVPVSVHVSLREALASLNTDRIVQTASIAARALYQDFGVSSPRIALAGLNPHAGEQGLMGHEEQAIIIPAVERLRASGINVRGPMPPDTMFTSLARPLYDAAICMYHDQALIPLKTLDMAQGVNVTLGLPIVRTSPDHGTAFDIAQPVSAGSGRADPSSLLAALDLAARMARFRKESMA